MELRPYQQSCVNAMLADFTNPGASLCVLPTGCLAKGTPIPLWDGTIKKVEDIQIGDTVIAFCEFSKTFVPRKVSNSFRTSLNPKPMIELRDRNEKITVTYDHPFYNGEGFYPLYQLIWGKMETSQRVQLKLLCKRYGQTLDDKEKRGLHSCCNETCTRCERLSQNRHERKNSKGSQNRSKKLAGESSSIAGGESYKWSKRRQQSGKFRMVFNQIQRMDRTQDGKNKNTSPSSSEKTYTSTKEIHTDILSRKNAGAIFLPKKTSLRFAPKKISPSDSSYSHENSFERIVVKETSPYYSLCIEKAPYTYCIGSKNYYVTHNSGKSLVIASFAHHLDSPILILAPSQEIIVQNRAKLAAYVSADEIGTFSASLKEKTIRKFTFGTIQSVYKHPEAFQHFRTVIVDEAHTISPKNLDSMYMRFFKEMGNPKIYGLTATPFRMETVYEKIGEQLYASTGVKMLTRMHIKGKHEPFWKRLLYIVKHQDLLDAGYLAPLEYLHEALVPYESIAVNRSSSDFNLEAYSQSIIGFEANILNTIAEAQKRYKSVLVFCAEVEQAEHFAEVVKGSAVILGTTPKRERACIIEEFKDGRIKTVFNVGVLTVGFDHAALDCVILLRPVRSPILYLQMLGRLTRPAPGKTHGTVIDLTGSCKALGRVESFEVYQRDGWAWDVRSEKIDGFHGRILFRMKMP